MGLRKEWFCHKETLFSTPLIVSEQMKPFNWNYNLTGTTAQKNLRP